MCYNLQTSETVTCLNELYWSVCGISNPSIKFYLEQIYCKPTYSEVDV